METNFRGFIPNAYDTKIMSSYVDENTSNGLKQNSKLYLNYEQVSYNDATTLSGRLEDLPKGGRILSDVDGIVKKQYRMNELTARQVMGYGCDDTICTSALFNFYQMVMELEQTWEVYKEVEVKPAYLTALAFVQGMPVSIERMKEMEKEDDKTFDAAKATLGKVLLDEGILDSMWEPMEELTAATGRDAFKLLYGYQFETTMRLMPKMAAFMRADKNVGDETYTEPFAAAMERGDLSFVNGLLLAKYKHDPLIDMGSTKEMQKFLYDVLKLPVRCINKPTPTEREKKKELAATCYKFTKAAMKGEEVKMSVEELGFLRLKAKTDDTAVDFALMMDVEGNPVAKTLLESMKTMKTIMTRRSLYYNKYPTAVHWKTGKVHASANQCAAATRRYSMSGPNLQQLPKKNEGKKVRSMIIPHHRNAAVVSLDFSGQELRLTAEASQDKNMLACYVGDQLKDMHSMTAAGAMLKKWGRDKVAELMSKVGVDNIKGPEAEYTFFVLLHKGISDKEINEFADNLRKVAKNVNFGATYDAQALTLSYTIVIPVKDAQDFLDAKYKMFPRVETWKDDVRRDVEKKGYATTFMGARRHLAKLLSDRMTANKAGRQGPNFAIQGSAAEQTKLAMGRVWDSGVCYDYDCRFYAQVHDELVLSMGYKDVQAATKIVHDCMVAQYSTMKVPSLSSISIGKNFADQIECGDWIIPDRIHSALVKIFGDKMKEAA